MVYVGEEYSATLQASTPVRLFNGVNGGSAVAGADGFEITCVDAKIELYLAQSQAKCTALGRKIVIYAGATATIDWDPQETEIWVAVNAQGKVIAQQVRRYI